ncbi:uncharacterized protein LAESUDRAFT_765157 [Laetiporus sulphureus 93-53]|uniref:Uncharacterized protein n=1 Tax=Laetiporus sulphureus 93-53 TaxID=1314785 RepID=A0A165AXN2_9APHY|nr:uncharacterized protein LAESUDRAFT_765157 [Laetiporus sulphureus 93-53]KZS99853.1 hypothetical protein LAESUDRAFT_765157 [Laetiporus sulphureus 93-53]
MLTNVFTSGIVIIVISDLITLISFLTLTHATLTHACPSKAAVTVCTMPLLSAHLLVFLTIWLFTMIMPFTDFVMNCEAKITTYLGSTSLSASTIQSKKNVLALISVYHKLGYHECPLCHISVIIAASILCF